MSWIACSERMPEPSTATTFMGGLASDAVLCLFPDDLSFAPSGQMIRTAYYVRWDEGGDWMEPIDGHGGLDRCSSHGGDVPTHWMPLPQPPATGGAT